MKRLLKTGLALLAKAIAALLLGLHVHHREHLPATGPAILVANHNSHLDALVLMALYPLSLATQLRPVANEHYFLRQNPWLAWFARRVLDIIPVSCADSTSPSVRGEDHRTFLQHCAEALAHNQILILFPEGSRGQPECLSPFHSGIAHLAKRHPQVPIVPIFLRGLGKALPKGDPLLVPFVCSATIAPPVFWNGCKRSFLGTLRDRIQTLAAA